MRELGVGLVFILLAVMVFVLLKVRDAEQELASLVDSLRERVDPVGDAIDDAQEMTARAALTPDSDELPDCDCGDCWPQDATGLPHRPRPLWEIEQTYMTDADRWAEIADLRELWLLPSDTTPPIIPGRNDQ